MEGWDSPSARRDLARKVIETYTAREQKIVTAESCTGGLLAAALTEISGSSAVVERGFIVYSNEAKIEMLGVKPELLNRFGAVSEEVAEAIAQGALEFSHADVAVSITGIAGPTGATPGKPVGLVCFALATRAGTTFHYPRQFNGSRDDVRLRSVHEALQLLLAQSQPQ